VSLALGGHASAQSPEAPPALAAPLELEVRGERREPARTASEAYRDQDVLRAAPHRTGGDALVSLPGMFITQHSGQGKAYQVFYRGFDAVHGQDIEFSVGGAPANDVSNLHGQGYADLHFVMPEVISRIEVAPGNYSPEQGDFAVAGSVRYVLGYGEPGVTVKGTSGTFGERRVFLAHHAPKQPEDSFLAFEAQRTHGYGDARAASRTSGIVQQSWPLGSGRLRILLTGYGARFESPGVVRLADIASNSLPRFASYGVAQGGFSSRVQAVADYSVTEERSSFSVVPYAIRRNLQLRQNYTGYLVNGVDGDTTDQRHAASTLGLNARYRYSVRTFLVEALNTGVSVRNDWITQSELDLATPSARVLGAVVDADVRALNTAGWIELALRPVGPLRVRAGLRVDALAYEVEDNASTGASPSGDTGGGARRFGAARSAMGTHLGPRASADWRLTSGLHVMAAYGEGFRSPQARSLGDGEKTPFTEVRSLEAGLRFAKGGIHGSLAGFRTTLNDDLVFDPVTARNEAVPSSERLGAALEFVSKPTPWFVSSGAVTFTSARFTASDSSFRAGDKLPYIPEWVVRQEFAFSPVLAEVYARPLQSRFGLGITGMFNRPQPFGQFGSDVLLADTSLELRLGEVALGAECFNLLDREWFDSEFTFSGQWERGTAPDRVPERHVTVGAPRTVLLTLSLFMNPH
jgi:hypothetical protein